VLTLRLSPEPASATRARDVTRSHLASTCPDEIVENAALVVTELVSNVVVHALTDMLLVVDVVPGRVDLRVQDSSPQQPRLQSNSLDAVGGRGLAIVDELASAWGVEHQRGMKVVWAELDYPAPANAVRRR
jgi:anti-sigma regulatory factor (Ser/Thr protein kinase)